MKIRLDVLNRFIRMPDDPAAARVLLDEVGVEVKRFDPSAPGVAMTLELLANRGDHHCYLGIAREVGGRTGGQPCAPRVRALQVGVSPRPIHVEAGDLCPRYTLTRLELRGAGGELDADALSLLASCGLASKGAVIDATNIANLEFGQPTHAFDADAVIGPITIRRSRAGESAWPLFAAAKVELPEGTLVIADEEKVLAIAGVIGCEESKATASTRAVLLESASFDPVSVRKASRALGIHTDSSARFERGADFGAPLTGAGRVAELLVGAGWEVVGETGSVGDWTDPGRTVSFDPSLARRFLGVDAPDADLLSRLERYGFIVGPDATFNVLTGAPKHPERWAVRVPTWRLPDVHHAQDLYEELAKSWGYDNTPIGLPPVDMGALPSDAERARVAIEEVLVSHGLYEVITDGFHSRALREKMAYVPGDVLYDHVETANALDRAYSLLKNSPLPQALDAIVVNHNLGTTEVKAFEFTRTFHPSASASNGVCTERSVVWAIATGAERERSWAGVGRPADLAWLRGVVTQLGRAVGVGLRFVDDGWDHEPLAAKLHPHRRLRVLRADGEPVGLIGEVHPAVCAAFKIKRGRPVYLELALAPISGPAQRPAYVEPPAVQHIVRNLAFTLPHGLTSGSVSATIEAAAELVAVSIVDRFDHVEAEAPVRTYTWELVFPGGDRTADDVNAALEAVIREVTAAWPSVRLRA